MWGSEHDWLVDNRKWNSAVNNERIAEQAGEYE